MIKQSTPSMNKGTDNINRIQPFLLRPACKDYLWGGSRLRDEFGKDYGVHPLAETWECSTHPAGVSIIDSGVFKGVPLDKVLKEYPRLLGSHPARTSGPGELPVLIKLIDAGESASVQVHPDDAYAAEHENGQKGKTEMWYVLDAAEDATLVYGFYQDVQRDQLEEALARNSVEKYLQRVKVRKDDVFYIEPGQVHAIGAGIVLAEIQQNSNVTYRLYDYDRRDADGKTRELHVEKALDVAVLHRSAEPRQPIRVLKYQPGCATELLCRCKYFQVERVMVNTTGTKAECKFEVGEDSFCAVLCIEGTGSIITDESLDIQKGNCCFIPAGSGMVKLSGKFQFLKIRC